MAVLAFTLNRCNSSVDSYWAQCDLFSDVSSTQTLITDQRATLMYTRRTRGHPCYSHPLIYPRSIAVLTPSNDNLVVYLAEVHLAAVLSSTVLSRFCSRWRLRRCGCTTCSSVQVWVYLGQRMSVRMVSVCLLTRHKSINNM